MLKKTIYCNGDSWTYGDEIFLSEDNDITHINSKYYNSWPWFLSKELDIPICVNEAINAGSNDRIFRKTIEFIKSYIKKGKNPKELMIVIGWTSCERTELPFIFDKDIEYIRITSLDVYNSNFINNKNIYEDIISYKNKFLNVWDYDVGINKQLLYMDNLRFICSNFGIEYYDFIAIGSNVNFLIKTADGLKIDLFNFYNIDDFQNSVNKNKWDVYEYKHPKIETHKKWAIELGKFINK